MGFGFGGLKRGISKIGKKMFSKRGFRGGILAAMGTPLAGIGTTFNEGSSNAYEDVHKGLGNLVTGGYISQKEATEEARKARDQAKKQYEEAEAASLAEAARIASLEEERKKRLLLYGTQTPQTMSGTYLGVGGQARVARTTLG